MDPQATPTGTWTDVPDFTDESYDDPSWYNTD
jgi:hypothetical protein